MRLHFVEVRVRDLSRSVAWYRDVLGLRVTLADEAGRFVLLDGVALKEGEPGGGVLLAFEAADVGRFGPVTDSAEGYRSVRLTDPDGYAVTVFAWGERHP